MESRLYWLFPDGRGMGEGFDKGKKGGESEKEIYISLISLLDGEDE